MADLIRDAPLGQLIHWATGKNHLQYPEERPGFRLSLAWQELLDNPDAAAVDAGFSTSLASAASVSSPPSAVNNDEKRRQQQPQQGETETDPKA